MATTTASARLASCSLDRSRSAIANEGRAHRRLDAR